ncbi:MAG: hypothetical protein PF501_18915 [Salinisphaera sp.]|jgi:hypothetical protein|nr:hypothetical protein [Salinisphaera sp.]
MAVESYPLCWPAGRPRTSRRERSRFDTTLGLARDTLITEIERLGGSGLIISTNVPTRKDGMFYASAKRPEDPGVAVYFDYKGSQHCFACDQWDLLQDNVQAIRKTIEALRGISRWGSGDMMERAFTGFAALPDPATAGGEHWSDVLGVLRSAPDGVVTNAYHRARRDAHPDAGGSSEAFNRVQTAWEQAGRERQL